MRLHHGNAESQLFGDVEVGQAAGDQPQHLTFPRRHPGEPMSELWPGLALPDELAAAASGNGAQQRLIVGDDRPPGSLLRSGARR
ncbi:hypothetical protein GCM10023196_107660 [Actinoallomurus vinaceus]|uniref:Uncharacterized protein n=1 Tax=Actinoallomurus vinaceus TaxID=1080074 RepID=A0ABP8UVR8_9ACTN